MIGRMKYIANDAKKASEQEKQDPNIKIYYIIKLCIGCLIRRRCEDLLHVDV